MKEIEIKILEIDVKDVTKQLLNLGAKKIFDGDVRVVYFDSLEGELCGEKKRLRLRDFGSRVELTFKEKLSSKFVKVAKELEVDVTSFKIMQQICEAIGLRQCREYTKHRVSYRLDGVSFELDTLKNCPTFLEIEALTELGVFDWVKKLGFKKSQALPLSGTEVVKRYKK